ncbi:MAG: ABC transporter permease [Ruminococcaceae bacterium]|nr:ABC transporter permease [Oscillospiraceae bacterium]
MKQILTVFKFTYLDALRKKAFIITTALLIALIFVVCLIPTLIDLFSGDNGSESIPETGEGILIPDTTEIPDDTNDPDEYVPSQTCYYFDSSSLFPEGFDALELFLFDTKVILADSTHNIEDIREIIKTDDSVFLVEITDMEGLPFVSLTTKDFMSSVSTSYVMDILDNAYRDMKLNELGVTEETLNVINTTLPYSVSSAGMLDITSYIVGILATLLIFFAVYYYGYGVAMSVATEKATRVMETLIVSAKPSRILIGKCLAMGALGLTQLGAVILSAVIGFCTFIPKDFTVMGAPLSLASIPVSSLVLLIVYFLLGYTLYAFLNSVCGATVSKIEDLNSAMMPVMFIALISFYIGYFSAISASETSIIQKIATYVPFTSPFIMPYKLLTSNVPTLDIILSVIFLIAAIAVVSFVSIKLYSASVLHYGKKLKFKDAYKTKL